MASVRHLGGDRWQVRVYAGIDGSGRRRQVTKVVRASSERQAFRKASTVIVGLAAIADEERAPTHTVGWLADRWLDHRRSRSGSAKAIARAEEIVEVIKKELGSIRLDKLRPVDVDGFYDRLRKRPAHGGRKLSESTVLHYHRHLAAIINQGDRWGEVDAAIIRRVTKPRPPRRTRKAPPTETVAKVLRAATGDFAVVLRLATATGARAGEIAGLRWRDIADGVVTFRRVAEQEPGKRVRVRESLKNADGGDKEVTLDAGTLAVLDAHKADLQRRASQAGATLDANAFVFPSLMVSADGLTPHPPRWVTTHWTRLRKKVGLSGVVFHDLRHWHATELLDAGLPLPVVSKRLGHSRQSTTSDIYAHARRAKDQTAADTIGDLLG